MPENIYATKTIRLVSRITKLVLKGYQISQPIFAKKKKIKTTKTFQLAKFFRVIYRVIQKESAVLWEMIVCVILSKKVHMNMGPILNGYRDMVKRRYGPSCEHEQQLRNK